MTLRPTLLRTAALLLIGPLLAPRLMHAATAAHCTAVSDTTLAALHATGQSFTDFLGGAKARREGWLRITDSARVEDALLTRARAVGGQWKLLVIAVDACGDSMNSVPYLAKLAAEVPGLDLRIVLPPAGRAVQQAHLSLDGRTATPTIVLLDSAGRDMGCIVELPREARTWAHVVRTAVTRDSLHAGVRAFYARDHGRGITTEVVEMLESAAKGIPACERGG